MSLGPDEGAAVGAGRARWTLALLFAAGVLNMFDRQIINVLAQQIKLDLHISDAQLGLLTGTAFGLFYAVLGLPLARVADRTNRVRLIGVALVLWSAFTTVCGFTRNFAELFAARLAVGVGEAGSQPASTALIPDLFAPRQRGMAMSLLLLGVPIGSFLGLMFGGMAGQAWGWRAAFTLAGLPGLVLAGLMFATLSDPRAPSAADGRSPTSPALPAIAALLRRPGYAGVMAGNICSTFLVYASGAWLPSFFIRVHDMKLAQIGAFAAVAVGLGGALGTIVGGIACDLLGPRVRQAETKILVAVSLLGVPALLGAVLAPQRAAALGCMFAFQVCAFAFLPPMVRATQQTATADTRALAVGLTSAAASVGSLGLGLPLVGLISDLLAPSRGVHAIGAALAIASGMGLVAAVAYGLAGAALARAARSAGDCRA